VRRPDGEVSTESDAALGGFPKRTRIRMGKYPVNGIWPDWLIAVYDGTNWDASYTPGSEFASSKAIALQPWANATMPTCGHEIPRSRLASGWAETAQAEATRTFKS
jgi:hypothetical protein